MSALPKQIQAQLDQAEAMQAEMDAAAAPQEGNPDAATSAEQPNLQLVEPVAQETQVTQQAIPDETWEQRFRVLEGKYRAEVPRLHEQLRAQSDQLDRAVQALENAVRKPEASQESKLVTDADVEAYGEDLVGMVRRASREEFNSLSKTLIAELDKRFGAVTEVVKRTESQVAETKADRFWSDVYGAHADYETVNNDPRWFAFLDSKVPGTRFTRRQIAEQAANDLDTKLFIEQLGLFKESIGATQQPPAKAKPNLNAQVAPSSSRASTPAPSGSQRIWTGKEYVDALDHRTGQRMERAEYEALIAEAEQALADGRVRF